MIHQPDAKLAVTLACGMSRMGKTTFILKYLVADTGLSCRFLFDPRGLMAGTLGLTVAETLDELEAAVEDGWVCYDPSVLFPGNPRGGVEFFSRWSYERAMALPGRKTLLVDEVWKYQNAQAIPQGIAEWLHDGAKFGCEPMFATQTPNKLNGGIVAELSELVCFRLQERNGLDVVESLGMDRAAVAALKPGEYLALNLFSGGQVRGRVF